jgi:gliding motility-associated-like protein
LYNRYKKYILLCCLQLAITINQLHAHTKHEPGNIPQTNFIQNNGQWDNEAKFMANIEGGKLYIEHNAWHFVFTNQQDVAQLLKHPRPFADDFKRYVVNGHAVRVNFVNSGEGTKVVDGQEPNSEYYNYFIGDDPSRWKNHVSSYKKITMHQIYNGIDAVLYGGEGGGLKYDFVVKAGSNPSKIRMAYTGQESIELKQNYLRITTSVNNWVEHKPYAYQWVNGQKKEVDCGFILAGNEVSFDVGTYDASLDLIIDPLLIFSTYSGSTVDNFGHSATYDNNGSLYAAGIATFATFPNGRYPATPGAFQQVFNGGKGEWPQAFFPCDIAISKYTPDGGNLMFATYLGGSRNDYPHSLVTDSNNELIVFGTTLSNNFPVKTGCYDVSFNDSFDIIVTKFSADGTQLIGSTYVGGSLADGINVADSLRMNYADEFRGEVIVDKFNDIIVATSTSSSNFPITASAAQSLKSGVQDGCIFKLDATLKVLKASTYMGQPRQDALYSLDVDTNGNIFFAGGTQSPAFSIASHIQLGTYKGGISDGFVGKINGSLTGPATLRYWGSTGYDQAYFVKLDPVGNPVVFGQHFDSIPIINVAYFNSSSSLFITKFKPALDSIIFSTSIGNGVKNNALSPSAFMVDECGVIYGSVWGGGTNTLGNYIDKHPNQVKTYTKGLPVTADAYQSSTDSSDFYLFTLSKNSDAFLYGTFFGELDGEDHVDGGTSRFDKKGIIYQSVCASCGSGTSGVFPTTANSYSPFNKSPRCSNASFKLDFRKSNVVYAQFDYTPKKFCLDSYIVVNCTNESYNTQYHYWYLNGVLKSTNFNFSDTIRTTGGYTIKLVEIDSSRCVIIDSTEASFNVGNVVNASFTVAYDTCTSNVIFTNTTQPVNTPIRWYFGSGDTSSAQVVSRKFATNGLHQILLIANIGLGCPDTAVYNLNYDSSAYTLVSNLFADKLIACDTSEFFFLNITNKDSSKVKWYVNDTLASTQHKLDTSFGKGTYRIKLVATDSSTCNIQTIDSVTVYVVPEVFPTFADTQDLCSFTVNYYAIPVPAINPGDTVFYYWDFGNGVTSNQKDTSIQYDTAGTYKVSLIVNPGVFSCAHSLTKNVTVNVLPGVLSAYFTANPLLSCTPGIIQFTNFSTNEQSLEWYYNDVLRTTTPDYIDTFYTDTIITVKLKIFSVLTCALVDSFDTIITIKNNTQSDFTFVRDTCSPDVFFINQSTSDNNEPLDYMWYFGDGDSSTLHNPSHAYPASGLYDVQLITNKGTFCADTFTMQVNYNDSTHLLQANFELNDSQFCAPALVSANNMSINALSNQWFLNDNLVSTGVNFSQTFNTPGNYLLKLVAGNNASCTKFDTIKKSFTVSLSGEAEFIIARDTCSLVVAFINQSVSPTGLPITYNWNFGDGDSSMEKSPVHTYDKTDNYTIILITNAQTPCADTATKTVLITGDSAKQLHIPNVFTPNGDGFNDCLSVKGMSNSCGTYRIKIYNRWGELYFSSANPEDCWNGTNDAGVNASDGVYFYILESTKPNQPKEELHGTITLIRE